MPLVSLDSLPDAARVWVFGADRPLDETEATRLRETVDSYLQQWRAHGTPLSAGRDWREGRFLTIAVDTTVAAASGCSIDALTGVLRRLEQELGVQLLGGGRVFWRDADGVVRSGERGELDALVADGALRADTLVFDPSVTSLGAWRRQFELPARDSWHSAFLPATR